MTQDQAAPTMVQIPGDSPITLQLTLAKVEQLVLVLRKQPFEAVAGLLPEILMQVNSQVAGLMVNGQKETAQ